MWRIRIAIRWTLVSAGQQLLGCGPPEVKRAQDVCALLRGYGNSGSNSPGTFTPRQEDRGWVIHHRTLKSGDPGLIGFIVGSMTNDIECFINGFVRIASPVVRAA